MDIKKDINKFYIEHKEDLSISEINFIEDEEKIIVEHIYVQERFRGGAVAQELIEQIIKYAIEKNKKIYPICSYVKKSLAKNFKEYKDIIIEDGTPGVCKIVKK